MNGSGSGTLCHGSITRSENPTMSRCVVDVLRFAARATMIDATVGIGGVARPQGAAGSASVARYIVRRAADWTAWRDRSRERTQRLGHARLMSAVDVAAWCGLSLDRKGLKPVAVPPSRTIASPQREALLHSIFGMAQVLDEAPRVSSTHMKVLVSQQGSGFTTALRGAAVTFPLMYRNVRTCFVDMRLRENTRRPLGNILAEQLRQDPLLDMYFGQPDTYCLDDIQAVLHLHDLRLLVLVNDMEAAFAAPDEDARAVRGSWRELLQMDPRAERMGVILGCSSASLWALLHQERPLVGGVAELASRRCPGGSFQRRAHPWSIRMTAPSMTTRG